MPDKILEGSLSRSSCSTRSRRPSSALNFRPQHEFLQLFELLLKFLPNVTSPLAAPAQPYSLEARSQLLRVGQKGVNEPSIEDSISLHLNFLRLDQTPSL